MKTGMLGIYDVDSNYANSLMEYISDKRGIPFRTVAFTELEALKEFAEKRRDRYFVDICNCNDA